jgi:hypothetical protein
MILGSFLFINGKRARLRKDGKPFILGVLEKVSTRKSIGVCYACR